MNLKPISAKNAEHYTWGGKCDGCFVLKGDDIHVIQERMPPGSAEEKYVKELVNGVFLPETRKGILDIARVLEHYEHSDGLILGGTELPPLLRKDAGIGVPLLDTTRIHVTAALERILSACEI